MRADPKRLPMASRRVVECLTSRRYADALDWAREVADLVNLTDICPRCNGRGEHAKHLHCCHNSHDAYCLGCNDMRACGKCHTVGRVLRKDPNDAG